MEFCCKISTITVICFYLIVCFQKVIESVKLSSDHKVVDILVLLILHSCGYRKQVETLSRSRIASGHFTHSLLQLTFSAHGQVINVDWFNFTLIFWLLEVATTEALRV